MLDFLWDLTFIIICVAVLIYTRTPTMYMDFTMRPGSQIHQPSWNAFIYIIDGEGVFGREKSAPVSAHLLTAPCCDRYLLML
uniref:Uncharacterized protein n=1 Tax=Setaria viridis TaxID=4556 RepID=A0A4U6VGC2_SETVI|nr:LOW QUALITY PROTEIN: hypothetical protein SEVIR_3G259500v2 [Setaria viridis]